jgi:outer membrane protein
MKNPFRLLFALAALVVGTVSLPAQPVFKLLVVDMAKVYDNHFKTEEANAKFREAEQKAQEQIDELNKQGQALVDEYKDLVDQSKNTVLTAEARGKAENDAGKKLEQINQKRNEVQQFSVNTRNSLQQRIKTHRDLLLEEIAKVVTDLAKKQGATLVVDRSGPTLFGISSVIYSDPGYDITDQVLKEVNKDRPAPAAAPAAAATTGAQFTVPGANPPKKP